MIVYGFAVGPMQANCYLLGDSQSRKTAVIDPGDEYSRILSECTARKLDIVSILLTHAHPDHFGAAINLRQFTGAELCCHRDEVQVMRGVIEMGGERGLRADQLIDRTLTDGETMEIGNVRLKVIHTPGHSPGGVCYLAAPCLFTGDTLFRGSIGRTDIPGGNHATLLRSIEEKLLPLDDELLVLPGHMGKSTLGQEKQTNPFLRRLVRRGAPG